ncbi:MAG: NAD(P)H-binding protein [Bacteroidetes bacterium]|nr:NAD(P)H-binding protein [Bacteroidota bacterium]
MIAIVGASGRIGSKTTEALLAAGKKVRAIARHAEKLQPLVEKGAEAWVGDSADAAFLNKAFEGAEAVLLIISTDMQVPDVKAYQDSIGLAQIEAVKAQGVKNVLFISSQGGHTEEKTGIVAGVARQEQRLHALEGVNVLILRPTYFMENTFNSIGMIKNMGINGSGIKGDRAFPVIASHDIAVVAAEKLLNLPFEGKSHLDLLGARDYTLQEMTQLIGAAIGKPELPYVEFSYADQKAGMMQYGMSESVADAFVGLQEGINIGQLSAGVRDAASTTPTTFEWFAENVFKHVYQAV